MRRQYRDLESEYYYIDKTAALEKEIERFPSVYIEGAAGCGKTTMMRLLLEKHPEVEYVVCWLDEEKCGNNEHNVDNYVDNMLEYDDNCHKDKTQWLILENVPQDLCPDMADRIRRCIRRLKGKDRLFLIGRDEIPETLLGVFWNREMGLVTQERMRLSREDIEKMTKWYGSEASPEELLAFTGGWAGVVDVILRLEQKYGTWKSYMYWHEMNCYIKGTITSVLQQEEWHILQLALHAPWVNAEICEDILGISQAGVILGKMMRKGILICEQQTGRWRAAPMFQDDADLGRGRWLRLGSWYESHGYALEQLQCLAHSEDIRIYAKALRQYGMDHSTDQQENDWEENDRQKTGLQHGHAQRSWITPEISLNLRFMQSQISLEQWMEELRPDGGRLLVIQETKVSCLCDIRDMSELFACTKRKEKQFARKWKECLDEDAWTFYRFARMEYYLETDRFGMVPEEDVQLLEASEKLSPTFRLSALWLLIRIQRFAYDENRQQQIRKLETKLANTDNRVRITYAKAAESLNISGYGSRQGMAEWLRSADKLLTTEVTEDNMVLCYCQAKGYLLMNQYEKARRLLDKMLPHRNVRRSSRIHAEILFAKAVAEWNTGQHGQALKSVIESFLVNGQNRYVMFYTEYGTGGHEVLEAYIDWMKHNSPEGWHRKKKYNYGNVLRMPQEDYLEAILRKTKREVRHMQKEEEYPQEEKLTMTETIILQYLAQGLTNAQICQQMNLKLPTVKGHIYNIYKKMDVKNRVQAVMKWEKQEK